MDPLPPHPTTPVAVGTADLGVPAMDSLFAESFLNDHSSAASTSYPASATPTLNEAILEPDMFLRNFGISDNHLKEEDCVGKMDIEDLDVNVSDFSSAATAISDTCNKKVAVGNTFKSSPGLTPTNLSPVITPKTTSSPPDHELNMTDPKFIDQYVGQRLMEEKTRTNTYTAPARHRHFYNGLDTIPEYQVTAPPSTFQPLVPPPVPVSKVATTTYNISFPRPLQLRDSFESWRGQGMPHHPYQSVSGRYSSGTGSSCSSSVPHSPGSSVTSPFHDAKSSNTLDVSEFHPLNVIEGSIASAITIASDSSASSKKSSSSGYSSSSRSSSTQSVDHKPKASKRSRTNSPNKDDHYDFTDGVSSRQRRKSSSSDKVQSNTNAAGAAPTALATTSESKRRDSIKHRLDELQRTLPQFGTPEEEKISQATVLCEAAKYLQSMKQAQEEGTTSLKSVTAEIEELNQQIERLQSQLPDNGAVFAMDKNNLVAVKRSLPDQFSDHVVDRTNENWKYWVFTSIMGHFVHSFNQEVSSATQHDLQTTSLEWITNSMSLQQLRKDVARKLAKLNAKTSISEDPSKLPEEARKFTAASKRSQHRGGGGGGGGNGHSSFHR